MGPRHTGVAPAEGQGGGRVNTGRAARTPQFPAGPTACAPSLGTARQPGRRRTRGDGSLASRAPGPTPERPATPSRASVLKMAFIRFSGAFPLKNWRCAASLNSDKRENCGRPGGKRRRRAGGEERGRCGEKLRPLFLFVCLFVPL